MALVVLRSYFYLPFLINHRKAISLYYLRHSIVRKGRKSINRGKQSTYNKAKGKCMVCASACEHDGERKAFIKTKGIYTEHVRV